MIIFEKYSKIIIYDKKTRRCIEMTATKQELYNTIELIPDSVAKELLNYADYLTSK